MASKKLVIVYEGPLGGQGQIVFESPPLMSDDQDCVIFAKGVLADREVPHTRILEVYITKTIYNAYEEGLEALKD